MEAAESDSEEEETRPARRPWSKRDPSLVGTKVPPFIKPVLSAEDTEKLENLNTAYDYYKLFQSESFANEVVYQSRLYAVQKGYNKANELLSRDTYRCTEAFLLHSGYNSVPRRKMLWEMKPDCHNQLVADAIRRDEVDAVLQCLHFRDNSKLDDDGYFKVCKKVSANIT